jgi:hypothetical protein
MTPRSPADELARRLEVWAHGLGGQAHAVAILCEHGSWLRHGQFVTKCVFLIEPDGAAVDWLLVSDLLSQLDDCQPFDVTVLRVAVRVASPSGARDAPLVPVDQHRRLLGLLVAAVGATDGQRIFATVVNQATAT